MNSLKLISKGIFSTKIELKKLARKDEAKILLISDSHGAKDRLKFAIENYAHDCDALFFSGDGAQDLLSIIEDAHENSELKNALPPVIAFVKGNNDPYQYLSKYNPEQILPIPLKKQSLYSIEIPKEVSLIAGKRKIVIVHGHEQGVYYSAAGLAEKAKETKSKIVVFGHTHIAAEKNYETYMVNPGSISLPRQFTKPGFAFMFIFPKVVYSTFMNQENRSKAEYTAFIPYPMY